MVGWKCPYTKKTYIDTTDAYFGSAGSAYTLTKGLHRPLVLNPKPQAPGPWASGSSVRHHSCVKLELPA